MQYIDDVQIKDKRILLRVDYNVTLDANQQIVNDERIRQSLPTITYLLKNNNQLILLSHLGRPDGADPKLSLSPVAKRLQELLRDCSVTLVFDLESPPIENTRMGMIKQVVLLENIRFFKGEESNDLNFAKELAKHGDIYVNDAFSVSHRSDASVVGLPSLLPSYGGLLLKKEIEMVSRVMQNPAHPIVAILGGAKISTKINFIAKLIETADTVLLGGGLANTFLLAQGKEIGKSLAEATEIAKAKMLLKDAQEKGTTLLLPTDVVVGDDKGSTFETKTVNELLPTDIIFDLGTQTLQTYTENIVKAKTIIWNGPVGYFEVKAYAKGTEQIFHAVAANSKAFSILGGGETITAIDALPNRDKISYISTGGGAMLEFIEKGTLPGIDALNSTRQP